MPVQVVSHGVARQPPEIEASVYFCVLEALQNVAKYAGASKATVRIEQSDGRLIFSISDDGRGMDPARVGSGSGMQNMRDRVAVLGGDLQVESSPGAGTQVVGSIPVAVAQAAVSRSGSNRDFAM